MPEVAISVYFFMRRTPTPNVITLISIQYSYGNMVLTIYKRRINEILILVKYATCAVCFIHCIQCIYLELFNKWIFLLIINQSINVCLSDKVKSQQNFQNKSTNHR